MNEARDTTRFIEFLKGAKAPGLPGTGEITIARAPGRLDLMGGIADYSGSLVLEYPIALAAHAALQRCSKRRVKITSVLPHATLRFEASLDELLEHDYVSAREWFRKVHHRHWASYVAGAFIVLKRERGAVFESGATIIIRSEVPEGKGVSSSAALEVASMQAIVAGFGVEVGAQELALLCQKVENLVAGAPCGVMDQMTAACGEQDRLLELLCRPAELMGTSSLPDDLGIWGIDSGVRHSVGAADYGTVRTAAFMGLRMIEEMGATGINYLTEITPDQFRKDYAWKLPKRISGDVYVKEYGATRDSVTRVESRTYPVLEATRHPIDEHTRVVRYKQILQELAGLPSSDSSTRTRAAEELGELMCQSHASYSACGLGAAGTDRIVELACEMGPRRGVYGAKITGGGSGGTVAVLARRDAGDAVEEIARRYGKGTLVISGSSPGAGPYGVRTIPSPARPVTASRNASRTD